MTQPLTTEQLDAIRERRAQALLAEVERLRAENERLRSVSWQNTVNRGGTR